jgi:hypothetical protein
MTTEAEINNHFQDAIKNTCESFYNIFAEQLQDEERMNKFVDILKFEISQSPEEIVKQLMQKNLHTLLYEDSFLKKIKNSWGNMIKSNTDHENKSSINFGIGDTSPETKKNQLNLKLITKKSLQLEYVQKNLTALENNDDFPFIALKIYTSKAEEFKAFAEQMMEMFGAESLFASLPIQPEIRFVPSEDHLIIEVSAKKSPEFTFMSLLVKNFLGKLPENDIELDFSLTLGTNFGDLINNHSENTIKDILNGVKLNIELRNNLKGFFVSLTNYMFSKAQKGDSKHKHLKNGFVVKALEFILTGLSINSSLNLNMGVNEANLMSKLPPINIFDPEGILSTTPISQAKMMMDSNEMIAPVLELLNSLEGKGELYLINPLLGAYGELDVSGILDLAMHVINLFSSE